MRRVTWVFLVTSLAAAPAAAGAQQFEGVIKQRSITVTLEALERKGFDVSTKLFDVPIERLWALKDELVGQDEMTSSEEVIYVKGDMVRADTRGEEGEGWVTVNIETGVTRVFQPAQRMYMEITPRDMEQMRAMSGGTMGGGAQSSPEPRATGLTATVNGMRATAYDLETEDGTTRVWVSKDIADLTAVFSRYAERMSAMAALGDDEVDASLQVASLGFPVLDLLLPHESYMDYQAREVLAIERQPVSDELFTPPDGFRKVTMAEMMRGR